MKPKKLVAETTADLEIIFLPDVVAELDGLKNRILTARDRLPQSYPELASGEPSRPAVLHGDLGILLSAVEVAAAKARTAATGVE